MLNRKNIPKLAIFLVLVLASALFIYKGYRDQTAPGRHSCGLGRPPDPALKELRAGNIVGNLNKKFPVGTKRDAIDSLLAKDCDPGTHKEGAIVHIYYRIGDGRCGFSITADFNDAGFLIKPFYKDVDAPCELT